jgi:hypothetical protein
MLFTGQGVKRFHGAAGIGEVTSHDNPSSLSFPGSAAGALP